MKVVFHGYRLTLFFLILGCLPFKAIFHFSTVLDDWVDDWVGGSRVGWWVGGWLGG